MACGMNGLAARVLLFPQETTIYAGALVWPSLGALPTAPQLGPSWVTQGQGGWDSHLLWVRKLPLAWPEPSQPGVGQVGPSFFRGFQEEDEPLREPSFCLRAARGQPDALL